MINDLLNTLQGQTIYILEIKTSYNTHHNTLTMKLLFNNQEHILKFINPSRISLNCISFPLSITGFEIINNSDKGWDDLSLYLVRDFEDNQLSFYCEKIEIV